MSSDILDVRGLCAGYRGQPVVHELDLTVRSGEVVVLLGPNGAGKTTTVLTLAGVLPPIAGTIDFDGAPLDGPLHRRARRGVSLVTETRMVFKGLTARANLDLGLGSVPGAVELFPPLESLLDRRGGDLSGGEQQMVTIGRALAAEPRLLLVDELSLGLAPRVVDHLLGAIQSAADRGVGVLMVEQHARMALSIADRAYVLTKGRVSLRGSAQDLLGRVDDLASAYIGRTFHPADEGEDRSA